MNTSRSTWGILFVLVVVSMTRTAYGAYGVGYVWDRTPDYDEGTTQNSTSGNPNTDAQGQPVWSYGWVNGGSFGSADPWYAKNSTLMVWDSAWFGRSDLRRWQKADDRYPVIDQHNLYQGASSGSTAFDSPMVTWTNPTGSPILVDIAGSPSIFWGGNFTPGDVELSVAIAHRQAESGAVTLLHQDTFSNPSPGSGTVNTVFSVDVQDLLLQPNDQLIFTTRAEDPYPFDRFTALTDDIRITIVPEPSVLATVLIGCLMGRRIRRRQ